MAGAAPNSSPGRRAVPVSLNAVLKALAAEPAEGEFLDEVLDRRIDRCGDLTRAGALRALELLSAAIQETGDEPELLESLVLLALTWPKLARRVGVDPAAAGRRAALLFEQAERPEEARALLETLADALPDDRGVDRDLAGLLRRLGDVDELARRYMGRAQAEIDAGRPLHAVPWLQEVLQADPGRKDIARLIRDLRYDDAEQSARRRRLRRAVVSAALCLLLVVVAAWREVELRDRFTSIRSAGPGDRAQLERRLGELEQFARRNPIWHGALAVDREVARVSESLADLARRREQALAAAALEERRRSEAAESARLEARRLVERERLHEAVGTFEQALALGGPEWEHANRVQRDIDAVQALIEESRKP